MQLDDRIIDLVNYRLSSARDNLQSAILLIEAGHYKDANNRAYYAIFHGIIAVHALDGSTFRRHKDAIANFNKRYVKEEVFPRSMGRKIAKAEEIRHASDYDDFYLATKEEAKTQIETAEEFLKMVSFTFFFRTPCPKEYFLKVVVSCDKRLLIHRLP